jgi:hypothetical protein
LFVVVLCRIAVVAVSDVNVPAAAAVPPIAGGLAKYVLNPVPETVLDADSVVNAPVLAVVAPTDMLLIVPVVPELIVIVPAPVVVYDWLLVVVLCKIAVVAVSDVNVPAAAAVPPIAGGLAKYVLNPVPETVLLALSVVNAPAAAAVPPIAGGLAKYVLNPVPETVLLALSVVNAPVLAVVAPTEALLIAPPLIVGLVNVLLVNVWVTSMPTRVVVASGIV